MGLFSRNTIIDLPRGENLLEQMRNETKRAVEIGERIDDVFGIDYRKYTISELQDAMLQATSPDHQQPQWGDIVDIFNNMMQDPQISGLIGTLTDRVLARKFEVVGIDEKLLHSVWFNRFIEYYVHIYFFGFGLIQFKGYDTEAKEYTGIELINQKHVKPHKLGVVKDAYSQDPYAFWNEAPYKQWTIFVEFDRLGALSSVARWWIFKNEVARYWAQYNQVHGVPPIIAKTKTVDNQRRSNLISFLKNWSSARYAVIDIDDQIEKFDTSSATSGDFYESFIRLSDEQISKGLLRSTMVLDNGSSRSQGEVHERSVNVFADRILKRLAATINKELFPRMQRTGFPVEKGATIVFKDVELTLQEKINKYDMLLRYYNIDEEHILSVFGVPVIEKEHEPFNQ